MRFATNPGESLTTIGVFPIASTKFTDMTIVSPDVSRPRTISTRGRTGTGLKKWSPRNRSGLPEVRPRVEIEIDDVFEAKIVAGAEIVASCSNSAAWLGLLNNRLDNEIRMCRVCDRAGIEVYTVTLDVVRRAPSARGQPLPSRPARGETPVKGDLVGVRQYRPDTGLGNNLGDAAAHGARTDHKHPSDGRRLGVVRGLAV